MSRTVGKAGGDTAVSRRVEVRMQEDMEGDKAGGLCKAKLGQYANMEWVYRHIIVYRTRRPGHSSASEQKAETWGFGPRYILQIDGNEQSESET